MPKCIVDYCRNYAGMRNNFANVILHGFPTTVERIKLWLRSIEQSGQIFENLDEMAERIHEGKKYDSFRVCSEHFTIQCYFVNGDKKILKKESVPTVFANRHAVVPMIQKHINKRKRQGPLNHPAKKHMKKKDAEPLKENKEEPKAKTYYKRKTKKRKNGQQLAQKILNLTLEIIALLTGEDYVVVKKSCPQVKLDRRTQCSKMVPQSRMLDWVNKHKILELTTNIIKLLTKEEQNNLKEHEEASTRVKICNSQSPPLPGVFQETDVVHPCFSSYGSMDVETVIVQDVQESNYFKISTWTTISEANGTKKLVLREDDLTRDVVPNEAHNSCAHIAEEPLLSEGEPLKGYNHHISTPEEPLPHRAGRRPHLDLHTHMDSSHCSSITGRSPCVGIIPPEDHVEHSAHCMAEKLVTSKGSDITEVDIMGQSDHERDSSTPIAEETQSLASLDSEYLEYMTIIIKEESLSPSEADLHIPDSTALSTIEKEPKYCEEEHCTPNATVGVQAQMTSVRINEEADSCGDEDFTQSTIQTSTSNPHYISYTIS